MPCKHGPLESSNPHDIPITASLRATGHEGLPDTYYLLTFPRDVKHVGVGSCILMGYDNSVYRIVLGQIRVRGRDVVEFLAHGPSFPLGFCFVQVPILRAAVSRLAILDYLRGLLSLTDPLPERRITATTPVTAAPSSRASVGSRLSSIEIYVEVKTSVSHGAQIEEDSACAAALKPE